RRCQQRGGRPESWRPCETFCSPWLKARSSREIASGRCLFRRERGAVRTARFFLRSSVGKSAFLWWPSHDGTTCEGNPREPPAELYGPSIRCEVSGDGQEKWWRCQTRPASGAAGGWKKWVIFFLRGPSRGFAASWCLGGAE